MRWSKLKTRVEEFLVESLRGRVEFRSTRYNDSNDGMGRGYITIDKKEIISFCSHKNEQERNLLALELQELNSDESKFDTNEYSLNILHKQGKYTQFEYYDILSEYLNLSFEEALNSNIFLIKILVVLDRRLGKRRLKNLSELYNSHEILSKFYNLRVSVESRKKKALNENSI